MNSNQFQPDRLRKLANHIIQHQKSLRKNGCCYIPSFVDSECYIGELVPYYIYPMYEVVKVFPKEWVTSRYGTAYWIYDERKTTFSSIMNFLDCIDQRLIIFLFQALKIRHFLEANH
jgi:hypothetical protein